MPPTIQSAARTDIGRSRSNNEDAFASDSARGLYVVCDGMGGRAAGEVASALACQTLLSAFAAQTPAPDAAISLAAAIAEANAAVVRAAREVGREGMGTTLVAAVIRADKLIIANVGDSRAYLLRAGSCTQITVDHSYVNELIRTGAIRPEDRDSVGLLRFESVITRAIGAAANAEPEFFPLDLLAGDAILLASDGLSRYLDEERIAQLTDVADLEGSCSKLIAAANTAGGADNITCLLLRFSPQ